MTVGSLCPCASVQFFPVLYVPRREIVGQRKRASLTRIRDLISLQSTWSYGLLLAQYYFKNMPEVYYAAHE